MNYFNLKFLTDTKINDINNFKISLIYIIYTSFIASASIFYCYLTINQFNIVDANNDLLINKLQFSYAGLIINLVNNWEYSSNLFGIKFVLARLPVLPITISTIIKISSNIYFIFLIKNFIFFSIYFFISFISLKYSNKNLASLFFMLIFSFIIPYNFHVGLAIFFADSIIYLILPSLFLITISNNNFKYYYISLLLIILYLTKTSMIFIVIFFPFLILILEKENFKKKSLPILAMILVIIGWGTFGLSKTGRFPILQSTITINSQGLYYIKCHPKFMEYYPYKSIDLLLPIEKKIDYSEYKDEWDVYDQFNKKNKSTECKKNSSIMHLSKKLKFIFFNVYKDNVFPDEDGNFQNPIIYSYILNKIFFNFAFFFSVFTILKNLNNIISFNKIKNYKIDIYYLTIVLLNLLPHLFAWATAKHLSAISILSMIYLYLKFNKFFYRTIK